MTADPIPALAALDGAALSLAALAPERLPAGAAAVR
jgi:hypothetical protein